MLISKLPASLYWRTLRKVVPRRPTQWAGVKSHVDGKLFDALLLPDRFVYPRDRPNYENALISGLSQKVRAGDKVTIIGGGFGITTVVASQLTGTSGSVHVYEGSSQQLALCKLVLSRNDTPGAIKIEHAIVGESVCVYGGHNEEYPVVVGRSIADCDVLQMDCEGAELNILKTIKIRPRVIIVETHGFLGAPTSDVTSLLQDMGYHVQNLGPAEVDFADFCHENDVHVLMATK